MRDDVKLVYLDDTSHPVAVPRSVYEAVKAMVEKNRICEACLQAYTDTNPQVAENVCLGCFLKHRTENPTHLNFVGEVPSDYAKKYGYQVLRFTDAQGVCVHHQ